MAAPYKIPDRILVAIGGNATHPEDIEGTSKEQKEIAAQTAKALLPLALLDNELVITHGNGPVVGKILMRQAMTRDTIAPMPLDICVAHSQGGIAYLLVQALENALREADSSRHVACLLTQVEVDENDPAFQNPTKPIGKFYSEQEAAKVGREMGWLMKEDAGRGWRHVVPSPKPKHVCDISLVQVLARRGTVVIAGGGGGIPVIRGPKGVRRGVEAVIDKDLTSAHMANVLGIRTHDGPNRRAAGHDQFRYAAAGGTDTCDDARTAGLRSRGSFPGGQHGAKDQCSTAVPRRRRGTGDHRASERRRARASGRGGDACRG